MFPAETAGTAEKRSGETADGPRRDRRDLKDPDAPGAGAVILFTILSGAGLNNELAMMAYSLVIAINRPIECW